MRFVVALLSATALSIVTANAADLPVKAPRLAPTATNWTGFYVGGAVGYGWSEEQTTLTTATVFPSGFVDNPLQKDGGLVGIYAGYNYQLNQNLLVGIDGEYLFSHITGTGTDVSPTTGFRTVTSSKMIGIADVAGRVGYVNNDWMIFGKAGWAWASFDTDAATFGPGGGLSSTSTATDTRNGWLVGVGAEWAFARQWSAKIEYDYVGFDTSRYTNLQTGILSVPRSVETDFQMVKVGLAYRF